MVAAAVSRDAPAERRVEFILRDRWVGHPQGAAALD